MASSLCWCRGIVAGARFEVEGAGSLDAVL
jgi:hypothetical protein